MRYFSDSNFNPSGIKADFLATAAYLGFAALNHFSFTGQANTASPADLLAHLTNEINNDAPDPFAPGERIESLRELLLAFKAIADQYDIKMTSYEAGQHLVPQAPMPEADQDALRITAIAANDDPGIQALYQGLENLWNEITGNAMITYFANTHGAQAEFDQDPFGMQKFTGQNRALAPKYDYLLRKLEESGYRHP